MSAAGGSSLKLIGRENDKQSRTAPGAFWCVRPGIRRRSASNMEPGFLLQTRS